MNGDPRSLDPPKIQNLAIFVHNGVEYKVGVICDAPHLLKNWKNALCRCVNGKKIRMDKSFQDYWGLETNEIELEAVQAVIDFQSKFEMKLHPKLTQKVLDEAQSTHGKMDVSRAMIIMSKKTSQAIKILVEMFNYPKRFLATAEFIFEIAHWFEIMSARTRDHSFSYRKMDKYDELIAFLRSNKSFVKTLIFYEGQASLEEVQKGTLMTTQTSYWCANELLNDPDDPFDFVMPARLGCDCCENFNSDIRIHCKDPTCVKFLAFTKAINLSHFFGGVMNSSYLVDDTTKEFLTDFKMIKQMKKDEEEFYNDEATEVIEHFTNIQFDPDFENCTAQELSEANSVSNYLGCILDRVIRNPNLKKAHCQACLQFYFDQEEQNLQPVNNFIILKQYDHTQKHMNRPSVLANKIFHECELLFRANRDKYVDIGKDMSKKLVGFLHTELHAKFHEIVPLCHFELILRRFMKGRIHFWCIFLTEEKRELNDEIREELSFSSRSARQMQIE